MSRSRLLLCFSLIYTLRILFSWLKFNFSNLPDFFQTYNMSLICDEKTDLIRQAKLLEFANSNRNDGNFNDVTIQAGAESIPANRMVLACYSKFFKSMFLSQLKERYQNTVEIKEFDGQFIKSVIEYIYTGKIDINTNNVMKLLGTADFLQVDEVKKMCFDYLETSLTVDNCIDTVKASVLYNNPSSHPRIYQFISENFDETVKTENFKDLCKQDLMQIVENLDRNHMQESSLYSAIINWVKHQQNRSAEFSSLFLLLDLQKLSSNFILDTIADEPLVQASNSCLNAILLCFKTENAKQQQSKASKMLYVGRTQNKTLIEIHNSFIKSQSRYPYLPRDFSKILCTLKLDDYVYCIVECTDLIKFKAYRLNLKEANSDWEEFSSIGETREGFGAAVWNGKLVVTGGYNDFLSNLNFAQLYEPRCDEWKNIAHMICGRDEHALVVANNKLFAIGGRDASSNSLATVELLKNETEKWNKTKPMLEKRSSLAAVTCGDFIYAIGGRSSNNTLLKTVERYDYAKDEWILVRSMNVRRSGHAACVLDGKIFVVGGKSEDEKVVRIIECYDPERNEWTVTEVAKHDFYGRAIVAV